MRPADAAQRTKMLEQDCLTTLIELDPSSKSAEVTASMVGFIPVTDDNAPLIAQMADPAIRIVALTVTEGGYYVAADGGFDAQHDIGSPRSSLKHYSPNLDTFDAMASPSSYRATVRIRSNCFGLPSRTVTKFCKKTLIQLIFADSITAIGFYP